MLTLLCVGAGSSAVANDATAEIAENPEILRIGRELATLRAGLVADGAADPAALIERITSLRAALSAQRAATLKEVQLKACETAWATAHSHGGFDPEDELTTNSKLAASIIRDLLEMD